MIVGKLASLARLIIVATYTGTSRLRLQQISSSTGNFKVKNCVTVSTLKTEKKRLIHTASVVVLLHTVHVSLHDNDAINQVTDSFIAVFKLS
jgi:hypothetical protein